MNRILLAISLLVVLTACGGGGGGETSPSATTELKTVTEYYDAPTNTEKKAEGPALGAANGAITKQGAWTEYFPAADGGGVQWSRSYANNTWATAQPWTEFNADRSRRVDSTDQ